MKIPAVKMLSIEQVKARQKIAKAMADMLSAHVTEEQMTKADEANRDLYSAVASAAMVALDKLGA